MAWGLIIIVYNPDNQERDQGGTLCKLQTDPLPVPIAKREVRSVTDRRVTTHPSKSTTLMPRTLVAFLVLVSTAAAGLSIDTLVTEHFQSSIDLATATSATAVAIASAVFAVLTLKQSREWDIKPYWVAGRPAVRYESKGGDYIKFERYDDGVSANWSTADGPQVLLSIPLKGETPVGQFWTSGTESAECPLSKLGPDLLLSQPDIIRAWVETESELIVWRLADPGTAGIAQLGVLMRDWSPERVEELVTASATGPVQSAVVERLQDAHALVTHKERL